MKRFHIIAKITLILVFFISSCSSKDKTFDVEVLTSKIWIYDSPTLPDSIKDFTDNFLIFEKSTVSLNSHNIGEYTITKDTLRIFKKESILQKDGKYQQRIRNQFVGIIVEADTNQILLKKISGYFPIKYKNSSWNFDKSQLIRLTNQESITRKNVSFSYVSIASSSCYGNCPEFNLEVDEKGNLKFHCASNCDRIGSYEGKLNENQMEKVQLLISYLNLKNDSTVFIIPMDAPETVLNMKVNNQEYYFSGTTRDFQFKMQELLRELFSMAEKSALRKTDTIFNFKAEIRKPSTEETIQFVTSEVTGGD